MNDSAKEKQYPSKIILIEQFIVAYHEWLKFMNLQPYNSSAKFSKEIVDQLYNQTLNADNYNE